MSFLTDRNVRSIQRIEEHLHLEIQVTGNVVLLQIIFKTLSIDWIKRQIIYILKDAAHWDFISVLSTPHRKKLDLNGSDRSRCLDCDRNQPTSRKNNQG